MTDFELLRDTLLSIRLDEDLKCVDEALEKNKPTVAEEGKKLGLFAKMGNSLKDSKTDALNSDKKKIIEGRDRFLREHKEFLKEEEIKPKFDELFKDDKDGILQYLFYVLISSDAGYEFFYKKEGFSKIENILGVKSGIFSSNAQEVENAFRDLTKNGFLSVGEKFDEDCNKKLDEGIIGILNQQRTNFIPRFVMDTGVYKLELAIKNYAVDDSKFTANELAIAYAIIVILAKLRKTINSKETRKELLSNLVRQETALLTDVNYSFIVEHIDDKDVELKYYIIRNFENLLITEFKE